MSAAPLPLLLWLIGIGCAALGLRARRIDAARAPRSAPASAVPGTLRLAARIPCPRGALAGLARDGDAQALVRAGLAGAPTPREVARMRAGLATAGAGVGASLAVLVPPAMVLAPLLAGLGLAVPGRWLGRRARRRREAVVRELPDLLDLLAICVESGMALDPALRLSADRLGGTLGEEIGAVIRDLELGAPRREAYRALGERIDAPELARTVAALLQAEELGAPLSGALQGQAQTLRTARRQAARERAAKAAPKIQLVVAMVMVPAVLLLVLGVLLIEMARQVGAVVG